MIAVIYRWRVAPEHEEDFKRRWHEITEDVMKHYGGGGSRLHKTEDGDWVAYARWSRKEDRDKAFEQVSKKREGRTPQGEGKAELIEEVWMEIVDDLLIPEADLPDRFH